MPETTIHVDEYRTTEDLGALCARLCLDDLDEYELKGGRPPLGAGLERGRPLAYARLTTDHGRPFVLAHCPPEHEL